MKILGFSDLHRDVAAARRIAAASIDADVVVGAGDFATSGIGAIDTIRVLQGISVPTIIVPGNHDSLQNLQDLCLDWPSGHLLHGTAQAIGKINFFGLGAEIPRRNNEAWNLSVTEQQASQLLSRCPDHAVLITHSPPFGCADVQRDGTHEGSKAIRASIENTHPVLHLCGHIHDSWGASGKIGTTDVHNLGPTINWFDI